jgi:hypothetical protein
MWLQQREIILRKSAEQRVSRRLLYNFSHVNSAPSEGTIAYSVTYIRNDQG